MCAHIRVRPTDRSWDPTSHVVAARDLDKIDAWYARSHERGGPPSPQPGFVAEQLGALACCVGRQPFAPPAAKVKIGH